MSFQPTKLDVDPSILNSNLTFVPSPDDSMFPSSMLPTSLSGNKVEELESLVPIPDYPTVTVTPLPGICVKTKNEAGSKFFINICKLSEIPAPAPMEEQELQRVIAEEDYSDLWRVPMSLGQPRKEKDKSGGECWAAEVAINSGWFESRMKNSEVFTGFVITVAIEGLADKYGAEARLDRQNWLILKNKKVMGEVLPPHRIQQRASSKIETIKESERGDDKVTKTVGLGKKTPHVKSQIQVTERSKSEAVTEIQPEFGVMAEPSKVEPTHLRLTVDLPGVRSGREVTLDVGEDRVVVGSTRPPYLLDIFLPYCLKPGHTQANFITEKHKLEIRLSVQ